MIISLVVSAITFGCATFLALELANWLLAREGGTLKASPQTMLMLRVFLTTASAVIGGLLASYSVSPITFVLTCVVCVGLAMATWCELGFGRVPDIVLLVPLAFLIGLAIFQREWPLLVASAFLAAPFAAIGLMSRGKGVARADGELAAVGGAILGLEVGLIAFGLAVLAAFFVNIRNRDGKTQIQLTPYLSSSIVIGILFRLALPVVTH